MTSDMIRAAILRGITVLALAAGACLPAGAQQGPYRYSLPPGWTSALDGSTETLTLPADASGSAQALLIAPKALAPDFDAQFDAERKALETHWGLSAPLPVQPQRGRTAAGPYAAHFASYASEGGPRYMSFLAVGRQGAFAMLVFVATSDETFNRHAPQATRLWQTLQLGAASR